MLSCNHRFLGLKEMPALKQEAAHTSPIVAGKPTLLLDVTDRRRSGWGRLLAVADRIVIAKNPLTNRPTYSIHGIGTHFCSSQLERNSRETHLGKQ